MPLSQKQIEYIALAWQCFETEPKINYEKFKTVAGLASAASARELFRVTRNKLSSEYGALSEKVKAANTPTTTPKKSVNAGVSCASTLKSISIPANGPPGSRKRGRPKKTDSPLKSSAKGEDGEIGDEDADAGSEDGDGWLEGYLASPSKKKAKRGSPAIKQEAENGEEDLEFTRDEVELF